MAPPSGRAGRPPPPEPDFSCARGDLGLCQATLPEGLKGDGKDGLESWQDDIPLPRLLLREDRHWMIVPCTAEPDKPWLLHFALETLRHENSTYLLTKLTQEFSIGLGPFSPIGR